MMRMEYTVVIIFGCSLQLPCLPYTILVSSSRSVVLRLCTNAGQDMQDISQLRLALAVSLALKLVSIDYCCYSQISHDYNPHYTRHNLISLMAKQIKQDNLTKWLVAAAAIGAGYLIYSQYSNSKSATTFKHGPSAFPIPLSAENTEKIAQQIKHQMLTVGVTFVEGIGDVMHKFTKQHKAESDTLIDHYRLKITEIYEAKEELILNKYRLTKEQYKQGLDLHKSSIKLTNIKNEIIDILENAIHGYMPNLTTDKRAGNAFGKLQLKKIYEDMCKFILLKLAEILVAEHKLNPEFNSNDSAQFKQAIHKLNAYDKRIQFLKQKGFHTEWGCPYEVFFKLTETEKQKDSQFKKEMKKIQDIYDHTVELISQNPAAYGIQQINAAFLTVKQEQPTKMLSRSAIQSSHNKQPQPMIVLNKSTRSAHDRDENEQDNDDDWEDVPDEAARVA